MEDIEEWIDDYLKFGIPCVWIISPRHQKAYVVTRDGMVAAKSGMLSTEELVIRVPLSAIFD